MGKHIAGLLLLVWVLLGQLAQAVPQDAFHDKYRLVQVIVLSRHNIRAPFGGDSLQKMTSHSWHDFGVAAGELTARGAEREESMGKYFRLYLQEEGLFSEAYEPGARDLLFYANAFQRTIATAKSFKQGMFPAADVPVKYNGNVGDADPVFLPGTDGHRAPFGETCEGEFALQGGAKALEQRGEKGLSLAAQILGSPAVGPGDLTVTVDNGLKMSGAARPYMKACDALTLQYYELGDSRASFGQELSFQDWQEVAAVKDLGIHVYRHVPTLARALARPVLSIFQEELNLQQRKFTFLCGHDTNIASALGALEVKETDFPETIEQEAPIGCKLVLEEWQDKDGESFVALKLIYPATSQLTGAQPLTAENPPQTVPLNLKDIALNEDGLITMQDFQQRLTDAITSDAELMGMHY